MHKKGVVNRDIKPANIMLQTDHRAVIIDFNVSKAAPDSPEHNFVFDETYSPSAKLNFEDNDEEGKEQVLSINSPLAM